MTLRRNPFAHGAYPPQGAGRVEFYDAGWGSPPFYKAERREAFCLAVSVLLGRRGVSVGDMRILHKRKASRYYGSRSKIRKINPRRRFITRRRRYTTASTARQLNPTNPFRPTARKLRKSRWRRALWNYTLPFQHYRSIISGSSNLSAPIGTTSQGFATFDALSSTVDTEFWKAAGGLISPQINFNPPVWSTAGAAPPPYIVIRGGRLWCTVSQGITAANLVRARVQLVFLKGQLRNDSDTAASNTYASWFSAITTTVQASANRSVFDMPDAEEYLYKPVIDKTYDFHNNDSFTVFWKIKPVKIDTGLFTKGAGWFPQWFVYVYQLNDSDATAETVTVNAGFNISFVAMEGDA